MFGEWKKKIYEWKLSCLAIRKTWNKVKYESSDDPVDKSIWSVQT